jgi:putative oxygen-independent coproporphyrinogen III oxidase
MAGLYLHIPFCRQKCHYCNFYSLATVKFRSETMDAMLREMELQRHFFGGEMLKTIYFGGGTPSLLPVKDIELLIRKAVSLFALLPDAEITLEANPDDLTDDLLKALKNSPVNRLSIGIQSFDDNVLKYLNRVHSARQALLCIGKALKYGFTNLSIDLIFGIPNQSDEIWLANIKTATSMQIPHISAYALTVEAGTALDVFVKKGKCEGVDDEKAALHFNTLMHEMAKSGYEHYEISNFSLPGHYAQHNTAYWNGSKYLGIGPSAHSYDGKRRYWNVAHLKHYIEGINNGNRRFEFEELSTEQHFNEYVMTALRTQWGIDLLKVSNVFGEKFYLHLLEMLQLPLKQKFAKIEQNKVVLTRIGKLYADGISARLFI